MQLRREPRPEMGDFAKKMRRPATLVKNAKGSGQADTLARHLGPFAPHFLLPTLEHTQLAQISDSPPKSDSVLIAVIHIMSILNLRHSIKVSA